MYRSDPSHPCSKPGNPRRLADKHEEVAIAATVGERRLVLLADLGDQRHGAMVPPATLPR